MSSPPLSYSSLLLPSSSRLHQQHHQFIIITSTISTTISLKHHQQERSNNKPAWMRTHMRPSSWLPAPTILYSCLVAADAHHHLTAAFY